MLRKIFSTYFLATFLAVTFAAGLVWLDSFRGYEAETTVLILEKGERSRAALTLSELARNLSFYDAVLSRNDLLDDPFAGQAPDKRKAGWHTLMRLTPANESGVVVLTAWADNQEQARLLSRETVATLFETATRFYNVKTDIELRIVDGPLIHSGLRGTGLFVFVSLLSGFAVTLVFFLVLTSLDRAFPGKRKAGVFSEERGFHITPETFRPTPPAVWMSEMSEESRAEKENIPFRESEVFSVPSEAPDGVLSRGMAKAEAPANLPIMALEEESVTPLQGAMARLMKEDVDATARAQAVEPIFGDAGRAPMTHEPTQEEFKRRLNDLLSGKM
ncbi:MAG: hypothetical protein ABI747_04125 [Candidatus Moraniibacteriota bacterium]